MAKGHKDISKENVQMAYKHMTRCSVSTAVKEMKFKTTMNYSFIPPRMAIIKIN